MAKVRKISPRYWRVAPQVNTVATHDRHGFFTGRKATNGKGDTTKSKYLIHDVDLNHDGRIEKNEHGGQIIGRTTRVKASGRAKGYERRV